VPSFRFRRTSIGTSCLGQRSATPMLS
jgi:hypothetical protein